MDLRNSARVIAHSLVDTIPDEEIRQAIARMMIAQYGGDYKLALAWVKTLRLDVG